MASSSETYPSENGTTGSLDSVQNFVENWIETTDFENTSFSMGDSETSSSVIESEDFTDEFSSLNVNDTTTFETTKNVNFLENIFNAKNNVQTVENIKIENSKDIHVGNIIQLTGSIHIRHIDGHKETMKDDVFTCSRNTFSETEYSGNDAINHFIGPIQRFLDCNVLRLVNRMTWLAQKPFEPYDYLSEPACYVIISHTATEMSNNQAENILLVRNIQSFHVESRRWNDIAYNFLIGGDGNVYEGRGWKVIGAHTFGYNKKSIGISFVGCFMRELPPVVSLEACKQLIKQGLEHNHLKPNYKLIAHCQCSTTESPGKMLFKELQNWDNFSLEP